MLCRYSVRMRRHDTCGFFVFGDDPCVVFVIVCIKMHFEYFFRDVNISNLQTKLLQAVS